MSKRKPPKALTGLSRFIQGLFSYYYDRGMPLKTARARMYSDTYDLLLDFYKKEKDVPDHILVIAMQHNAKLLNQRGVTLSNKLKETKEEEEIQSLRTALNDLKKAKDSVDAFITTYRGEVNGEDD